METSRNKFTNLVCVLFSVSLAALFCFSIGIRFGIDNMVSRAIIAAIYCGIVVGLAFALNKIVNKSLEKGVSIEGDKVYKIAIGIDIIAFILLRLLIISDVIKVEFIKNHVFSIAKIGEDGAVFVDLSNIDNIFATILSFSFKLFGNTFLPVYLIQFIISGLSFAFILVSVYKIFGRISSAFVGFMIAVMPVFFKNIASSGSDNLIILLFSISLLLTAKYKDVIEVKNISVLLSLLIGIFTGICALYSSLLILAILIPILVLWDCSSEYVKDRVINTFVIIVGHIISFFTGLLLEAYLFTDGGVLGFADALIKHINFRFVFSFSPSYIQAISEDTSVFLLLVIAIIYCVIYWKNDEDSAHIVSLTTVLFVIQLCGFGVNNFNAASMLLALLLMVIGGCGISNLGYTDSVRVYKIADDMQPAVIESLNDKPVIDEIKNTDEKENFEKVSNIVVADKSATNESIADANTADNDSVEKNIVANISNETVSTLQVEKESEMKVIAESKTEDDVLNNSETDSIYIEEESKYAQPEVRKTSDYGINNADFESLFSGTNNLPKFVYDDLYTADLENENIDSTENDNGTDEKSDAVINDYASDEVMEDSDDFTEETSIEETNSDELNENIQDDSKDKKAYVDSFFGYLYSEEGKFEAFEPIKPLDDIPEITDKEPVVEEYVSHADKFADLDLDLGFDAFDNINVSDDIPVEEKETEAQDVFEIEADVQEDFEIDHINEINIPEEDNIKSDVNSSADNDFFFDEDDFSVEESNLVDEMIHVDSFEIDSEDEISLEEMLEKKIDEDFSFEDAISKKIADEEIEKEIGFSFEQALERKLDVEESINNAILKNEFSFEEALNDRIIAEEAVEEAVMDDNISAVHSLSNKIKLDDILETNSLNNDFSIQEAIETKIDVEKSIENATNEKMLEEFGDDDLFEGVVIDFSGESKELEEDVEYKVDSVAITDDVNITTNEDDTTNGLNITDEVVLTDTENFSKDDLVDNVELTDSKDDISEEKNNSINDDIQFIENPLPLPKKHVHREMDYGRVIPSAWMHYDIEIDKSNNHYDI